MSSPSETNNKSVENGNIVPKLNGDSRTPAMPKSIKGKPPVRKRISKGNDLKNEKVIVHPRNDVMAHLNNAHKEQKLWRVCKFCDATTVFITDEGYWRHLTQDCDGISNEGWIGEKVTLLAEAEKQLSESERLVDLKIGRQNVKIHLDDASTQLILAVDDMELKENSEVRDNDKANDGTPSANGQISEHARGNGIIQSGNDSLLNPNGVGDTCI